MHTKIKLVICPQGLNLFVFRPLNEKQKIIILCVLCASAVKMNLNVVNVIRICQNNHYAPATLLKFQSRPI